MSQFFFRTPFALSGTVTVIPNPVQGSGDVSMTEGFGSDYSLPNANPSSKKVPRDNHNWLFNTITEAIQILQAYGCADWVDAAANDGITNYSYSAGAVCKYTDGARWISLVNTNTSEPSTDPTKWALAATTLQPAGSYSGVVSVTSTPYVILAADRGKLHICTGSASVLTMPAIAGADTGNSFPIINLQAASDITVNRDGASTFAGVSGSTTAFVLSPWSSASPSKTAAAVWTVEGLISNNSVSRKGAPAAQTLTDTTAQTYTFAHGLGVIPSIVTLKLTCTSADLNYSVNDVIILEPAISQYFTGFFYVTVGSTCQVDATNVVVRTADFGILISNKTSFAIGLIANSKWDLSVEAFA